MKKKKFRPLLPLAAQFRRTLIDRAEIVKKINESSKKIQFPRDLDVMTPNFNFGSKLPSWIRHLQQKDEQSDNYPPSMEEYMKGQIKFYYGLATLKMEMFQSPRGIRLNPERPNKVSLKFKGKKMSVVDLKNLIEYLEVLHSNMV